jgi:hypothetical protein
MSVQHSKRMLEEIPRPFCGLTHVMPNIDTQLHVETATIKRLFLIILRVIVLWKAQCSYYLSGNVFIRFPCHLNSFTTLESFHQDLSSDVVIWK